MADAARASTGALIALGSNHNALANLHAALALLRERCHVVSVSSVYRSAAIGETAGGPDYLNAAVGLDSGLPPDAFKIDVLRQIEAQLGRRRGGDTAPGAVPIDLDIALWGDQPIVYGAKPWRSPAPNILRDAFVAIPLAEIAQDTRHPDTGERLADIAARFDAHSLENLGRLLG